MSLVETERGYKIVYQHDGAMPFRISPEIPVSEAMRWARYLAGVEVLMPPAVNDESDGVPAPEVDPDPTPVTGPVRRTKTSG